MKKAISVLLILAALLSLGACGGEKAGLSAPAVPEISRKPVAEIMKDPNFGAAAVQQALVQTALAYYYQNPNTQYESDAVGVAAFTKAGGRMRTLRRAPEMIAADNRYIDQCSGYVYDIFYNTFNTAPDGSGEGFETYGGTFFWGSAGKHKSFMDNLDDPAQRVFYYKASDGGDLKAALKTFTETIQPGDIIEGDGHIMFYAGDCLGDGTKYVLHCWPLKGGNNDEKTGEQKFEQNGAIVLQSLESLCLNEKKTAGLPLWRLGYEKSCKDFAIIRPILNEKMQNFYISGAAATRYARPGMGVYKSADISIYDAAVPGSTVTVTETVINHSAAAYEAMTLTEAVPQGTSFASCSEGGTEKNGSITWSFSVLAGESVTVTYAFAIPENAKIGEILTVPSGYLDALPTRTFELKIGYGDLSDAKNAILEAARKNLKDSVHVSDTFMDLDFANSFYRELYGVELNLPKTVTELLEKISVKQTILEQNLLLQIEKNDDNAAIFDMMTPRYPSGKYFIHSTDLLADEQLRQHEILLKDCKPGDIFVGCSGSSVVQFDTEIDIFVGGGKIIRYTEKGLELVSFSSSIAALTPRSFFFALRPSRTMEALSQ